MASANSGPISQTAAAAEAAKNWPPIMISVQPLIRLAASAMPLVAAPALRPATIQSATDMVRVW